MVKKVNGRKRTIAQTNLGAKSELAAAAWLMDRGYLVFRNLSSHGMADLAAYNPETQEFLLADAKTSTIYPGAKSNNHGKLTEAQKRHGVRLITVDHTVRIIEMK